jgi:hypothetical protein
MKSRVPAYKLIDFDDLIHFSCLPMILAVNNYMTDQHGPSVMISRPHQHRDMTLRRKLRAG